MKYTKIFLLLVLTVLPFGNINAEKTNVDTSKVYIHQIPSKELITVALNIVIDKLDKEKIYTRKQMLHVINDGDFKEHNCKVKKYLIIDFTMGKWSEKDKRYCIFSKDKNLEGMCLIGLFDGLHIVSVLSNLKIHKTAFAHELLHYFRRHIDGPSAQGHEPKELWARLVGFEDKQIGILNEELKKAGL